MDCDLNSHPLIQFKSLIRLIILKYQTRINQFNTIIRCTYIRLNLKYFQI
jgi:hypothetical protein